MDEGRLGDVRRREDTHRKYMCVINDVTKSRWELLDAYIKRDKHETIFRMEKSVMSVRRSLVKQRVLQQCMKMRRDALRYPETILGRYGGKAIESFSNDVENVIADMHPKRRHLRKLQKIKLQSIREGAILLPSDMEMKIKEYFQRILTGETSENENMKDIYDTKFGEHVDIFKGSREVLPPIPGLMKSFHKIPLDPEVDGNDETSAGNDVSKLKIIKDEAQRKRKSDNQNAKNKSISELSKVMEVNAKASKLELEQKPSIILPPIENSKT